MRRWKGRRMRSARRRTPNLLRRLETWNFTVRSAMLSLLAISLLERFSRSESRTSCSRRLRLATESDLRRRVCPERMGSTKRKSADELVACFGVGEDALYAEAEKRKTVGVLMGFADDDQAGVGMAFENIGEQCAGGLTSGVCIDDVN